MKRLAILLVVAPLAACTTTQEQTGSINRPTNAPNREIRAMVDAAAITHGVPNHIAHGVVKTESNYRCNARNPRSGASGMMQVLPRTARGMGIQGNLMDCKTGLDAGMRYLKMALDRGGANCQGISLYERGINAPLTCTAYGRKVLHSAS